MTANRDPIDPGMDTPTAPISDNEPQAAPKRSGRRGRKTEEGAPATTAPVGLKPALLFGLRHAARCWRPLIVVVLVQLALGLFVAVPFHSALASHLDHHAHAPALSGAPDAYDEALGMGAGLDGSLWRDILRLERGVFGGLAVVFFWVVVLAWLFGALAAGGFAGLAAAGGPRSVGRFVAEGGRWFFRMFRVGVVFLLVAWLLGRGILEAWGEAAKAGESSADTGGTAFWGRGIREVVFVLLFLWMRVAADLARADLVVYSRRSAFLAFLRGIGRTIGHPVRTIGLALLLGVPAFGLLLALGLAVNAIDTGAVGSMVAVFVLVQVAVLIRWVSRAALLGGDVHLVRPRR